MSSRKINKKTTIFFIFLPVLAVLGTIATIHSNGFYWQTLLLALVYVTLTGLGITMGYHRLFAHKAYTAVWPLRAILVFFGTAAVQGSVLEWCTDHRNHHRYTDQDQDPYTVKKGFWFAHIGWIFVLDPSKRNFDNVKELAADPMLRFQHKHFTSCAIISSALVPTVLGALWGDPWGGLFIAGALRLTFNHHMTFLINSLCHYWGKLTYERGTARDNYFISLLTYGEGFHNFHHKFAIDYRNGIRWFDFDPSKWVVFILSKIGMASNLKRISKDVILHHRLEMQEQALKETGQVCETKIEQWLQPLRERIKHLHIQIRDLKTDYLKLKENKLSFMSNQIVEYKEKIANYRQLLKQAKKEKRRTLKAWFALARALKLVPRTA